VTRVPRLARIQERLRASEVRAAVLVDPANIAYATAFEGVFDDEPAFVAVVESDSATIYTDSRYAEVLSAAAEGSPWQVVVPTDDLLAVALKELADGGVRDVGLESTLSFARFDAARKQFDGATTPISGWVEGLRAVKDDSEIACIVRAQALADRAFDHILGRLAPGARERDIALELEFFIRGEGSEGVAFPPIVASGPNSALPHARPGERVLSDGDLVVLDFGARIGGYCSDMTRTVVIGKASDEQRSMYEAVLAANLAGLDAVRSGASGRHVDRIAREVIAERGYAERFGHSLGHGVGLEVHERPNVGPKSEDDLVAGNVVTVEPGVYIPGLGGVRIEDLVVVQEGRSRILTASTKDLLEL
jgi:Xaa-Pro aminopeptidase